MNVIKMKTIQKKLQELKSEGIDLRHQLDEVLTVNEWEKINRIIDIELLLEAESNK